MISEENIPQKSLKRIEKQQAIGYLRIQIQENKTNLGELFSYYTSFTENIFNEAIKGLESMLHPEKGYVINEETLEVYQAFKGSKEINKSKDVREVIEELESSKKRLNSFLKNPKEFYESDEVGKLSLVLDKLWEYYL